MRRLVLRLSFSPPSRPGHYSIPVDTTSVVLSKVVYSEKIPFGSSGVHDWVTVFPYITTSNFRPTISNLRKVKEMWDHKVY